MKDFIVGKKKWILTALFAVGIAVVVLPVIAACGYTYLCEDDFSFEGAARDLVLNYGNIYVGAAHRMAEYYKTNQGTFLFNYLMSALMMYSRGGLPLFHLFMIIVSAAFFLSLFHLIRIIAKDITAAMGIFLALCVTFFGMINTYAGREVFLWYTGMLNFLVEFTLSLLAVSFSILYIRTSRMRYAVAGMILGFFASGGALNVTASNVGWLLAVLILTFPAVRDKKLSTLPFAGAFTGAMINAVAPGNFNRLGGEVAPLYVGLKNTFLACLSDEKYLLGSWVFWAAMIAVFLICVYMKTDVISGGVNAATVVVVLAGTCLVRFFTMFPLAYANNADHVLKLGMRMMSSYEIVAKMSYVLFTAVLAQWMRKILEKKVYYVALGAAAIGLLTLAITFPATKEQVKESMTGSLLSDFRNGSIRESYTAREYVITSLELAEDGTDVVIYVPEFRLAESMYGMGLGGEPQDWVNISAAGLFRLNSVSVVYSE